MGIVNGVADTEDNAEDVEERGDTAVPAKVTGNVPANLLIHRSPRRKKEKEKKENNGGTSIGEILSPFTQQQQQQEARSCQDGGGLQASRSPRSFVNSVLNVIVNGRGMSSSPVNGAGDILELDISEVHHDCCRVLDLQEGEKKRKREKEKED